MRGLLIILLLSSSAPAFALGQVKFATGLGLESRIDREVNPGYTELRPAGQVFQQVQFHPWTLALEFGYEKKDSQAGALRVQSVSGNASAWGRYSLIESDKWEPFVAAGLGAYFDRVTSTYAETSDRRRGLRWTGGFGFGISKVMFDYLLLEAEARLSGVEDRKDPLFALILRAGVQL